MNWLSQNWEHVLVAVTSVITTASVIVKMTPSTHDDEIVNGILKVLQWLSINGKPKN